MSQNTLISGALLQEQMLSKSREDRLADEPFGPEKPKNPEEGRQYFDGVAIEAGDTVELMDGVEATIDAIVPAYGDCGMGCERLVHYSGSDENGEFRDAMPAWMVGSDLFRGEWTLQE